MELTEGERKKAWGRRVGYLIPAFVEQAMLTLLLL